MYVIHLKFISYFLFFLFVFSYCTDDTRLSLDMDLISDNNEGGLSDKHITPEQLYRKLHNANTGTVHSSSRVHTIAINYY